MDYSLSFQSRNYPFAVAYRGCDPYHSGNDRKPVLRCSPLLGARMDDCGNLDCVHIVARLYCCTDHFHIVGLLHVVAWRWCLGLVYVGLGWFMVCVGSECPSFLALPFGVYLSLTSVG